MDYGVPDQNVADYGEQEPHYDGHYDGGQEGNYDSVDNLGDSAGIKHDSSSSEGKLFVGGIAWETSEESFNRYFRKYGEITDSVIMMDKLTGRPRGFGFVTFADVEVADKVLQEDHVIDGRAVEIKRTVPREDMRVRGVSRTKKIFVGGLPLILTEDDLREYFSSYGDVVEHQIMLDHETGRSRGFGFVTFDTEEAVEKIFSDGQMHELGGKRVEIKRAEPKRAGFDQSAGGRPRRGGYGGRMGSYGNLKSGNFASGSDGYSGGYGGKMGRGYSGYGGGYGGYGNFPGNYAGGAAGFYPGYGGYGYGYGFGGPMYGGGAYGGGGYGGAPVGYGAASGYGVGKGYAAGATSGYDGGKGFGGGVGGGYGPGKGYGGGNGGAGAGAGPGAGGGYGTGKGYGNGSSTSGRFHPYHK